MYIFLGLRGSVDICFERVEDVNLKENPGLGRGWEHVELGRELKACKAQSVLTVEEKTGRVARVLALGAPGVYADFNSQSAGCSRSQNGHGRPGSGQRPRDGRRERAACEEARTMLGARGPSPLLA